MFKRRILSFIKKNASVVREKSTFLSNDIPLVNISYSLEVSNEAFGTIRNTEEAIHEAVIMQYLLHLAKESNENRVTVVSPSYPNKMDSMMAYEFTYNNRKDFDIALIPYFCTTKQIWTIGIYERKNSRLLRFPQIANPLDAYPYFVRVINTVVPFSHKDPPLDKILPLEKTNTMEHKWKSGVQICFLAKEYIQKSSEKRCNYKKLRHEIEEVVGRYRVDKVAVKSELIDADKENRWDLPIKPRFPRKPKKPSIKMEPAQENMEVSSTQNTDHEDVGPGEFAVRENSIDRASIHNSDAASSPIAEEDNFFAPEILEQLQKEFEENGLDVNDLNEIHQDVCIGPEFQIPPKKELDLTELLATIVKKFKSVNRLEEEQMKKKLNNYDIGGISKSLNEELEMEEEVRRNENDSNLGNGLQAMVLNPSMTSAQNNESRTRTSSEITPSLAMPKAYEINETAKIGECFEPPTSSKSSSSSKPILRSTLEQDLALSDDDEAPQFPQKENPKTLLRLPVSPRKPRNVRNSNSSQTIPNETWEPILVSKDCIKAPSHPYIFTKTSVKNEKQHIYQCMACLRKKSSSTKSKFVPQYIGEIIYLVKDDIAVGNPERPRTTYQLTGVPHICTKADRKIDIKILSKKNNEKILIVNQILKTRISQGKRYYLVSWLGRPNKFNSWEKEKDLNMNYKARIDEFKKAKIMERSIDEDEDNLDSTATSSKTSVSRSRPATQTIAKSQSKIRHRLNSAPGPISKAKIASNRSQSIAATRKSRKVSQSSTISLSSKTLSRNSPIKKFTKKRESQTSSSAAPNSITPSEVTFQSNNNAVMGSPESPIPGISAQEDPTNLGQRSLPKKIPEIQAQINPVQGSPEIPEKENLPEEINTKLANDVVLQPSSSTMYQRRPIKRKLPSNSKENIFNNILDDSLKSNKDEKKRQKLDQKRRKIEEEELKKAIEESMKTAITMDYEKPTEPSTSSAKSKMKKEVKVVTIDEDDEDDWVGLQQAIELSKCYLKRDSDEEYEANFQAALEASRLEASKRGYYSQPLSCQPGTSLSSTPFNSIQDPLPVLVSSSSIEDYLNNVEMELPERNQPNAFLIEEESKTSEVTSSRQQNLQHYINSSSYQNHVVAVDSEIEVVWANYLDSSLKMRVKDEVRENEKLRIVRASTFTINVDVENSANKATYPHADSQAPMTQNENLNPEKLPWKESRKHVKSIAEKLQKCYGVCTVSEEDTCLLITDTLLIGLNETCLSNCQVVRAEWPFIPRWLSKTFANAGPIPSQIKTIFYVLGYDLIRCSSYSNTDEVVGKVANSFEILIEFLENHANQKACHMVQNLVFVNFPAIGILANEIKKFNECIKFQISRLFINQNSQIRIHILDWDHLLEAAVASQNIPRFHSMNDRLKILFLRMCENYGLKIRS